MRQHGLMVIHKIKAGSLDSLKTLLNDIGKDIDENGVIQFYSLSTVHFMRWVVLDPVEIKGESFPAQLVLSTNHDGPQADHIQELIQRNPDGIRQIYAHCEGYPSEATDAQVFDFIKDHELPIDAFYQGTMGRSVEQIQQERGLRNALQNHLYTDNPSQEWTGKKEKELYDRCVSFVKQKPELAWAQQRYVPPAAYTLGILVMLAIVLLILGLPTLGFIYLPLVTGIVLALIVGAFFLWKYYLNKQEAEERKNFTPNPRVPKQWAEMTEREDFRVQNQVTHLVNIKPGKLRLYTLKVILGLITLLAKYFFNRGNLAGIPSIHYARWTIIDEGRRLLFFSNFDGSWESYLGDFIDKAAVGLTAVWTNTEGFPPTKNLIFEGVRNSSEFKAWARCQQIPTQVWYSAYKTTSVKNVNNNTAIRKGIMGTYGNTKAKTWLQRL